MNNQTVYVIDDNDIYRQSACWLLEGMGYEFLDFDNPQTGLKAVSESDDCACLLLDVRMPGLSGLEVHDKLLKHSVSTPVIYMTGHGHVSLAVEAMRKGAVTFLEKPLEPEILRTALHQAFEYNHENRERINQDSDIGNFKENLNNLTPREREVMDLIVDGNANKVIAFDLGISQKTVELHRARVMKKLAVKKPQELVKFVMLSQ